jgi:hypothetical protein
MFEVTEEKEREGLVEVRVVKSGVKVDETAGGSEYMNTLAESITTPRAAVIVDDDDVDDDEADVCADPI